MKLWFKNFRITILNWLAAGRITIEKGKPMSYTINPNDASGAGNLYYGILGSGAGNNYIYNTQTELSKMNITASSINFNVAKAAGGWIVQVNKINRDAVSIGGVGPEQDLHIIHETEDFDSALGKIVTMSCLKA
jgi:hypothetical protein